MELPLYIEKEIALAKSEVEKSALLQDPRRSIQALCCKISQLYINKTIIYCHDI